MIVSLFGWNQQLFAKAAELEQIVSKADEIANAYHQMGWFSGSILLAQNGKVFHNKAYGFSNRGSKLKNTKDTRYNLGSIAKNFTAVLLLQQVEKGVLGLDDKLARFSLGFPKQVADKITLRHLLTHRSGFNDIFTAAYRDNPLAFDTLDKKLLLLRDAPLRFEPGSDYHYSNYGYIVLGKVLEKVTGKGFEMLLKEHIFKRLQMSDSTLDVNPSDTHQSLRYSFNYAGELKLCVGIKEHPGARRRN